MIKVAGFLTGQFTQSAPVSSRLGGFILAPTWLLILAHSRTQKGIKNIIIEGRNFPDSDHEASAFIHHKLKGNSL